MIWVLTIEWAGQVWCWSTDPTRVPAEVEANTIRGLDEVGWDDELVEPGGVGGARSRAFELLWPEVVELEAEGFDLASGVGELAVLGIEDAWVDREILIEGVLTDPEYGDAEEPVSFSLAEKPHEDTALFPESTERVDGATWSSASEALEGRGYPTVFGKPGIYQRSDGTTAGCSAVPALPVDTDKLLVARHWVAASSVKIYSEADDASETFAISYESDGLDQGVAVVDISGAGTITPSMDGAFWSQWESGGLAIEEGTALETAGELLAYFLRRTDLRIDEGALAALQAPLSAYKLGGYLDEQVSPWQWIQDNLLPILPVSIVAGPGGLAPVLWRWSATEAEAVAHLVAGRDVVRDGRVVREREGLVNELGIQYALRARTGEYLRRRVISGDPARLGTTDSIATSTSRQSFQLYGRRPVEDLVTDVVYDQGTADRILADRVGIFGIARRKIAVTGALSLWHRTRPGAVVLFSDSSLGLEGVVALVIRVEWSVDVARLILWLL